MPSGLLCDFSSVFCVPWVEVDGNQNSWRPMWPSGIQCQVVKLERGPIADSLDSQIAFLLKVDCRCFVSHKTSVRGIMPQLRLHLEKETSNCERIALDWKENPVRVTHYLNWKRVHFTSFLPVFCLFR